MDKREVALNSGLHGEIGMRAAAEPYFARTVETKTSAEHQAALERCIGRLHEQVPVIGLRNPKIGDANNRWIYCDGSDWVVGFYSGILLHTYKTRARKAYASTWCWFRFSIS